MTEHQPPGAEPAPPDEGAGLDLWRYIHVLRKRMWIIAAVVAVGVTASVLYTMRQEKIYQATASVIIDPKPAQVFGSELEEVVTLGTGSWWSDRQYYNTQLDIITGFDLAKLTVIANDLHEDPEFFPRKQAEGLTEEQMVDAATRKLRAALSAQQKYESRVVWIRVRDTNPKLAAKLANMHVQTYLDYTRGLRSVGTGKVSKFLAKELDTAEAKLRESERKLYEFKQKHDILSVSLEDKQNILAADLARYNSALSEARIKRIELASLRKRAKGLEGEEALESPVFALTSKAAADALKSRYVEEKQRLAELGEELGPRHPGYLSQKQKVDELYTTIQKEAERAIRELDERYKAALDNEQQLGSEVERLKQEAFELGPLTVEFNRLKRQEHSDEEKYNLVLGRLRTSDLSGRNKEINIHPHGEARGAALVHPRMRFNIAAALALSLMLGIGLAFLLDYLDRTVKSAEDIDSSVGAPLLGIIPVIGDVADADPMAATHTRDLYVHENPTSRAAECCRSIRTNILFSSTDRPMKKITVSSPRPREGKTTSSVYLGTIMAQSGAKVLLVDSDLRMPRLHKAMGVSRNIGLTTVLLGEASLEDAIKTTDIPNLYLLPAGPQPPNPAELLLTNRFQEVLGQLEERFDRILLDSPPLLAVTDGVVLARLSDGVVLVTQAGKTLIDDAAECARTLRDVDAAILGVILNDLDLSEHRYGYGYYYYRYGYGRGGYGEEPATADAEQTG